MASPSSQAVSLATSIWIQNFPPPKKPSHIPHHESENQIDRTKLSFKQIAWRNVSPQLTPTNPKPTSFDDQAN